MPKILFVMSACLVLMGCASQGNQSLKEETAQSVSAKIVEGKTTKEDVRAMFGDPIKTSFTSDGALIWTYILADMSNDAINFVPIVNAFAQSYSGTKKELVILFDDYDRVKRYSMSESDVDMKGGLLK